MSSETSYVPTVYMCGRIKVTNGFTRSCTKSGDHEKFIDGRKIILCDMHDGEYRALQSERRKKK